MVGNLENTGWSKVGKESLYNVYIMDETHTILGCGAGAVTKLKSTKHDYLQRIFNFKYPYEYIDRFEEMVKRKDEIYTFYQKYL
jgi:oxygen-independent coproporphyrinogen-3 oxidase